MSDIPDIEFRNVSVSYGQLPALEDVSIVIPHGSFWGIIGPNGSGKSTLVKAALGLLTPWRGEVRTFGRPPAQLGELRARIGYVPQYTQMDFSFPIRVIDAVMMGLYGSIGLFGRVRKEHREQAMHALRMVQLEDFAGRHISELSGGQRQRVLIARALVVQPRLLILDEPTAALDHSSAENLYDWINELHLSHDMTILLITHEIGVVSRHVDTIACMNRTLVAHGRPQEVLTAPTLETMYGCGAVLFSHGEVPHMVVRPESDAHGHHH
ncbi:MAG: metal ABC transporter ATP-binding protein [Bacteroidia bacterium]|nr:metal ABC transporter ATP-binding protein [Bacteroidia bacterium]